MGQTPLFEKRIEELIISGSDSVNAALKRMNEINRKLLIVENRGKCSGLFSIGDAQRAILSGKDLGVPVGSCLRDDCLVARLSQDHEAIKEVMLRDRVEYMPILDDQDELKDVVFWEDLFRETRSTKSPIDVPVFIMAGGLGTRLKPLTNVIPKALIPIRDKPIIEEIINRFAFQGASSFFVSVNYKGKMIRDYFDELVEKPYTVEYVEESRPMGTAGSLRLIRRRIASTFMVSNCDILIDHEYSDILDFHRKSGFAMTVVSALKSISIPYGVIKTDVGGVMIAIDEKPDLSFQINAGLYVIEPRALSYIPEDGVYHITDLMKDLLGSGEKIGVFPINERSWMDMGEWGELQRMTKLLIEGERKDHEA